MSNTAPVLTDALRIQLLGTAIRRALDELGVPGAGYPSPVANAHEILLQALKEAAA